VAKMGSGCTFNSRPLLGQINYFASWCCYGRDPALHGEYSPFPLLRHPFLGTVTSNMTALRCREGQSSSLLHDEPRLLLCHKGCPALKKDCIEAPVMPSAPQRMLWFH